MFYKKSKEKSLSIELFKNPTSEYRGAPFWAWNNSLDNETLEEQIKVFKEMGFGGYHIHTRTGLKDTYLGEKYMDSVRFCTETSKSLGMLTYLYDDDRWPSGAAGGMLAKRPECRARCVVFTANKMEDAVNREQAFHEGKPYLIAAYDIILNENDEMTDYYIIGENDSPKGMKRYIYCITQECTQWYNGYTYGDTLSTEAMGEFIKMTHERYKEKVGEHFGNTIKTMFADEAQFTLELALPTAKSETAIGRQPWTFGLEKDFADTYGYDIVEKLPEVFLELENGKISKARYDFHDYTAERYAQAFADTCGNWCKENGLVFTGHLPMEDNLRDQSKYTGESMRSYRSYELPGIDVLCNNLHLSTAKQAQSVSHQYGREGVLSELYGVTNWDFDFRGHKYQGDWQAALGITLRVPHLSLLSMEGESKRDYPASINYQSPWCKEYRYIEDHFSRLNTVLTRGKPMVDVAIIHPIESYWLYFGPNDSTIEKRNELDSKFADITSWLLDYNIDFDYISESLLPELMGEITNSFRVGEMSYKTVIVPECVTLRSTTADALEKFSACGGRVIFMGNDPLCIDGTETERSFNYPEKIEFSEKALQESLKKEKTVKITCKEKMLYNRRKDNDCEWLFIAHKNKPKSKHISNPHNIKIVVDGEYSVTVFDTLNGEIKDIFHGCVFGKTVIETTLFSYDSLLLRLEKNDLPTKETKNAADKAIKKNIFVPFSVEYELEEPNVLLLDYAKYRLDGEAWNEKKEVLKLDAECRKKLGMHLRCNNYAQPYTRPAEKLKHTLELEFSFDSEIKVESALLALENAENTEITLNGEAVSNQTVGYYVDKSIKKVKLPKINKGKNVIRLKMLYGNLVNVENCYLLGDFNVKLSNGSNPVITKKTEKINFGDITEQGLPFYGGNIKYKFEIQVNKDNIELQIPYYCGALINVSVDGEKRGRIVFDPNTLLIENVASGKHIMELTLFGNRYNTFGGIHNADKNDRWYAFDYWRTTGAKWTDSYILKTTGIVSAPLICEY